MHFQSMSAFSGGGYVYDEKKNLFNFFLNIVVCSSSLSVQEFSEI